MTPLQAAREMLNMGVDPDLIRSIPASCWPDLYHSILFETFHSVPEPSWDMKCGHFDSLNDPNHDCSNWP